MAHSCLHPNSGYHTTDKINKNFKSKENKIVIVFAISFYLKILMQMHILGSEKIRNNLQTFTGVSFNYVSSPCITSLVTGGTEEFLGMCVMP